jgi:hypothetical protein
MASDSIEIVDRFNVLAKVVVDSLAPREYVEDKQLNFFRAHVLKRVSIFVLGKGLSQLPVEISEVHHDIGRREVDIVLYSEHDIVQVFRRSQSIDIIGRVIVSNTIFESFLHIVALDVIIEVKFCLSYSMPLGLHVG